MCQQVAGVMISCPTSLGLMSTSSWKDGKGKHYYFQSDRQYVESLCLRIQGNVVTKLHIECKPCSVAWQHNGTQ